MFNNYLKIAWRSLKKHGGYSFINILGLSIGIAFVLLIGAYVWNELQVNKSLKNSERQYFLRSLWKDPNLGNDITTLGPLAKRLKEEYPNLVANYYRWDGITSVVSKENKHFRENIQLGDSTLLSMFGFSLLHGDARTALNQPYSVVITQEKAIKYFGKTDVVGETISIQSFSNSVRDFLITGVLADAVENSVTRLNSENNNSFFIPTNTFSYFGRMDFESWSNIYIPSYIELKEGITPGDLQKPIQQLISQNTPDAIKQNISVQPVSLTQFYLKKDNGLVKRMLTTLSFVGLFILLMAIVNFVNISIGSSATRMKEIGMRKVLGGRRKNIAWQFIIESIMIMLLATILALIIYPLSQGLFGKVVGKELPILSSFPKLFVLIPAALIIVVGTLAGIYPALHLSAFKSIDSLKGQLKVTENIVLRKLLVGLQFGIAAIVMIAAFIVSQQVSYFFGKSIGYNKEYIVTAQAPRDWTPAGVQRMETIRNEFATMPQVSSVTLSYEIPNGNNGGQPLVYKLGEDSTKATAMLQMVADENYLKTYGIPLKTGSFFKAGETDSSKVVLNEEAAGVLGWKNADDAIGKQVRIPGSNIVYTITGVTSNYHFGSMLQKVQPSIFIQPRLANIYRYLSFKIKPGQISNSVEAIERKWASLLPGSSFEYTFMDDTLRKVYASEMRMKDAAYTATVLALVVVLLGVLGLLSLSVQKRTKEIGIRKVLGASLSQIISLFLKEFLPVILIGGVISVPVSWYLMKDWLNNYAYRINLTAQPFLFSIVLLGLVTTMLICARIWGAASVNPAKSLRTE